MRLEWASVIQGSEKAVGIGKFGAARCVLRLPDGSVVAAVIKRLPESQVVAEAFAALLLGAWGLPVPTPYLVADGESLAFASADASYPNLLQRLGAYGFQEGSAEHDAIVAIACHVAAALPSAPLAAAADEAIGNRDRNLGNILWDGSAEAWIDHALSFDNAPGLRDRNILCELATHAGRSAEMADAAISRWAVLNARRASEAADVMPPEADASHYAAWVATRLSLVGERLVKRFPQPNDLLARP